jgi:hypothetical protein
MAVISVNATGAEHLARNYIEPTKPDNTAAMSDKRKIDPHVRAKLEELGADVVRSKLIAIMEVRNFAQHHEPIPLDDGITTTRRELQQWPTECLAPSWAGHCVAGLAARNLTSKVIPALAAD